MPPNPSVPASSSEEERSVLTGLDAAFFLAERDERLMSIACIWTFKSPLDRVRVKDAFRELVNDNPLLQKVVRKSPNRFSRRMFWEDYEDYALDDHLVFLDLGGKMNGDAFRDYAAEILSERLVLEKPLWKALVIEGLEGGGSAMIAKAHHSLSDGQGFVRAFLGVTSAREFLHQAPEKPVPQTIRKSKSGPVFAAAQDAFYWAVQFFVSLITLITGIFYCIANTAKVTLFTRRSFLLRGQQTASKQFSFSEPISLGDIKFVRKVYGTTVNDVLVAVITSALRAHVSEVGDLKDDRFLYLIPVSVRRNDEWKMANLAGGAWLFVPADVPDVTQLLPKVQSNMMKLKKSLEAKIMYLSVNFSMKFLPYIKWMTEYYLSKGTAVVTNIPGPTGPINFAGSEIDSYLAIPPQLGPGSLAIGVMSYNQRVYISVYTDAEYKGRAKGVTDGVVCEFNKLLKNAKEREESIREKGEIAEKRKEK